MSELTTSANIAYLPSNLDTTIEPMLYTLSRLKKKWKIQIIDDKPKNEYVVRFEDRLNISVPKNLWEDFTAKVLKRNPAYGVPADMELDLSYKLQEAIADDVDTAMEELETSMRLMTHKLPFVNLNRSVVAWINSFGKVAYNTAPDILLRWEKMDSDLTRAYADVRNNYRDDRGSIEMIIDAIQHGNPLNVFDVFKKYNYLAGSFIQSRFNGVSLSLESTIDMSFNLSELIRIQNIDVVDQVEADFPMAVGIARGVIYPRAKYFPIKFYKQLKDIIQDQQDKQEETHEHEKDDQ